MGELWVAYEIELIHEKLNEDPDMTYARFYLANPTSGFANLNLATLVTGNNDVSTQSGQISLG